MKKEVRKAFALMLICLMVLGSCGEEEESFVVTVMTELFPVYGTESEEAWLDAIEQETDVDLQVTMIPTLEYVSAVERLIRSNRLPMVLTVNETILRKESFATYLDIGGFWALDDYLDDYPELKNFVGEEIWENSRIQGHIYGIPRLRVPTRSAAFYRKDWAEALGIEPPQNLEEVYAMLKAFTLEDPDGNGENDTVGLVNTWQDDGACHWNGIQMITTVLGGPNGWRYEEAEDQMIPDFSTESYMEMLSWFRNLYREGFLDHTFAFLTAVQRQELFIQGYAGMIFSVIDDAENLEAQMRQIDANAEIGILPVLEGPEGVCHINGNAQYNGLIVFNRQGQGAIEDEEQLRQVLSFYNTMCGQRGQELLKLEKGETNSYVQFMPSPVYVRYSDDSALQSEVYDMIEERKKYVVPDDSSGLYSETYVRMGDILNERIRKASIRFIMGEIVEKDFWEEYRWWYDNGGGDVIKEYTESYKEKIKIQSGE